SLGEAFLERIEPGIDLLILCDPNNPTGRTVHPALLDRIVERCAKVGTRLMIDECFNELLDEPEAHSLASRLMECPHVILLRAFTKSFAMPGLRLGYALCGSAALAGALTAAGQPWPVSTPAQAAGLAALGEENYLRELRRLLREERAYLLSALCALGCRCVPGEANFILFYHADRSLCDKLFQRGILLRGCSDFAGLGPGWYRAAVRTRAENERFVQALEEVLRHG
ncbi:MAG: aminotransferase class I/II-fold pyridoxal phosphate-dependent enzyme, partial [Oscillospiraceae bacterium]|nr:aminotransferase class I/II-fold pyridoxal phosphate-dependent enzyme [Oscillospiraceae bacterium]